jgi:hypothetical protein
MGKERSPMLADTFRPLTADNFNAVLDTRPILTINGIVFKPRTRESGKTRWHGADGNVADVDRLEDLLDLSGVTLAYLAG